MLDWIEHNVEVESRKAAGKLAQVDKFHYFPNIANHPSAVANDGILQKCYRAFCIQRELILSVAEGRGSKISFFVD